MRVKEDFFHQITLLIVDYTVFEEFLTGIRKYFT